MRVRRGRSAPSRARPGSPRGSWRIASWFGRDTSSATTAGSSGDWRSLSYCDASSFAGMPELLARAGRARASRSRFERFAVDGDRPRREVLDEHLAVAVEDLAARALGLERRACCRRRPGPSGCSPARLQEPQAREERAEQGDDDDADDADSNAAVVTHAEAAVTRTRVAYHRSRRRPIAPGSAAGSRPASGAGQHRRCGRRGSRSQAPTTRNTNGASSAS